jgi:SAM-dependent methyltransferase
MAENRALTTSLIYRSAAGYALLMRALYGRHYAARLRAVADRVPPGASVLELCPGPGALYQRHLRHRNPDYTGLDVNDRFVARLRRLGADAQQRDLSHPDPLPTADVVIIQASLYQFLPAAGELVDRMLGAARQRVVIAEPIRNLASSGVPLVAIIGRRAADPGAGHDGHAQRFNEQTLDRLMARYAGQTEEAFLIAGRREKVYVLAPRPG